MSAEPFNVLFLGSLEIKHAEGSDEGKYECVAENDVGVVHSISANVYVRGMLYICI